MMIRGIEAALDFPHAPSRLRIVSFMTDGYIGNETEILAAIHEKLGDARIFSFGVGSSVNRYLIERMAITGRGAAAYVGLDDADADREVDDFYERIGYPALADIRIDWGNLGVSEVFPSHLPDLHVGRPLAVTGRFDGNPKGSVRVEGRVGGEPVTFTVAFDASAPPVRPALAQVWARMKIADLADRATYETDVTPLVSAIRTTALDFSLVSPYTAFVAVDSLTRTGGNAVSVPVAVPVPKGVRYETTVEER
jgi:Ca-activated chloride channel family protein